MMPPDTRVGQRFLLLPMPPTPNGRLHLGHAAGPYLRADVLARHLRRRGASVRVSSGTDPYENWVLLDGLKSGRTPAETCDHFYACIQSDLHALDIACDDFVNPLAAPHAAPYNAVHGRLLDDLRACGQAVLVDELFPVSQQTGRCLVGVWLFGRCPNCDRDTYGNACEACGYHYQPSEIVEPRGRICEGPVAWEEQPCWFLKPPPAGELLDGVGRYPLDGLICSTVRTYIGRTGGRTRLSLPETWGIHLPALPAGTVASNSYYAYCLYLASLGCASGTWGALQRDSGVRTVAFFGIDNAIAGVVTPVALAHAHGDLKPFDHVVVNHFMNLERKKFSTSRNHAVWVGALLGSGTVCSDEMRLQLALCCPETKESDLSIDQLVVDLNRTRTVLHGGISAALHSNDDPQAATQLHAVLRAALERQDDALRPERLSITDGARVLLEWLDLGRDATVRAGRAWLQGVAELGAPYIPGVSAALEAHLQGVPDPGRSGKDCGRALCIWPGPAPALTRDALAPFIHMGY
jgi:methionyl-tRNA synthetase